MELVLLRSLDFESEDDGIRCQRFKRKAFLNYFGLQSDTLLPLAAALLGNDETGTKTELNQVVDKIFAQIKHEKRKSVCPRHQRISAILKRLGREKAEFSNDIGKKHALKKYDKFALNTSCFWGSTGSNITPVVQFHEIFVTKI